MCSTKKAREKWNTFIQINKTIDSLLSVPDHTHEIQELKKELNTLLRKEAEVSLLGHTSSALMKLTPAPLILKITFQVYNHI